MSLAVFIRKKIELSITDCREEVERKVFTDVTTKEIKTTKTTDEQGKESFKGL